MLIELTSGEANLLRDLIALHHRTEADPVRRDFLTDADIALCESTLEEPGFVSSDLYLNTLNAIRDLIALAERLGAPEAPEVLTAKAILAKANMP